MNDATAFWSRPPEDLLRELDSAPEGLGAGEARRRFEEASRRQRAFSLPAPLRLFLAQFKSFITLILLFSAVLSMALSDSTDGIIILCILFMTALLSFWQEHGAEQAVKKLTAMVQVDSQVLRDGRPVQIPVEQVVSGDVAMLSAGDLVPGDCVVLETKDLFVDESPLTGETFPAEKHTGVVEAGTPLASRSDVLWFGTHVVSGTARALVVKVGRDTQFGEIQKRLSSGSRETDFQRGVAKFGAFLGRVTFALVLGIFFLNVYFHRPVLESLLFSLALAVGLTPQLLPAVISVNLAWGARAMAAKKVIVRRLASIENFGSMDALCSDKTGTLTSGKIRLKQAVSPDGGDAPEVLQLALLNASFQTGFSNPMDAALREAGANAGLSTSGWERLDEVPYDFLRKRLSILARSPEGENLCVSKGAFANILEVCDSVKVRPQEVLRRNEGLPPSFQWQTGPNRSGGEVPPEAAPVQRTPLTPELREELTDRFGGFGDAGLRAIGVATKTTDGTVLRRGDETGMTFVGFLIFEDPIREDTAEVIDDLGKIGVTLRIITGDNARVAASIARQAGIAEPRILTGPQIRDTGDGALVALAEKTDVFAEVEPNQKERLVLALKKGGHVVGYMGDGINDISALNAADVGISVDGAVDAAKQAADMILLERNLRVLLEGVSAGRRTFANTMKYVFMATSANFGNMSSMACAALFLPFLPLLPKQILLTNILTDLPEMAMSSDNVDPAMTTGPQRWNIGFIRSFMIRFGLLSSVFDLLTFAVLLSLNASPDFLRTGWFVESVVSAVMIVLLIRTRRPLWELRTNRQSRPNRLLVAACTASALVAVALPFTPPGRELMSFVALPPVFVTAVIGIVLLYVIAVEAMKRFCWPKG